MKEIRKKIIDPLVLGIATSISSVAIENHLHDPKYLTDVEKAVIRETLESVTKEIIEKYFK